MKLQLLFTFAVALSSAATLALSAKTIARESNADAVRRDLHDRERHVDRVHQRRMHELLRHAGSLDLLAEVHRASGHGSELPGGYLAEVQHEGLLQTLIAGAAAWRSLRS